MKVEQGPQILERYTYKPQPFNLAERMYGFPDHPDYDLRMGNCFVTGVKLIPSGTPEFDEAVMRWLKRFDDLTEEKIEEVMAKIRQMPHFPEGTSFRAWRYVNSDGITSMADGCPYQGILTDLKWLSILYLDTSKMIILPFGDPENGPHRKLFYDAIGMKGSSVRTLYTGSLIDAIIEFNQKQKFSFDLAKLPANYEENLQRWEQYENSPKGEKNIRGVFTERDVSFERVLEVISSDPAVYTGRAEK